MRLPPNERVEHLRLDGPGGGPAKTNSGAFVLFNRGQRLHVIVSDGGGWDHVSVSLPHRCPTWDEMDYVKRQFFYDNETVIQLHVARAEHVNFHPYCLHLWRPQTDAEIALIRNTWGDEWPYGDLRSPGAIPLPPSEFVGPKLETVTAR